MDKKIINFNMWGNINMHGQINAMQEASKLNA